MTTLPPFDHAPFSQLPYNFIISKMTLGRQNTLHDFMTGRTARRSFRNRTSPGSHRSYSLRRATLAHSLSVQSSSVLQSSESLNINTTHIIPYDSFPRIRKFSLDLGPSGIPSLILAVEYLKCTIT